MTARPTLDIRYQPDALHPAYKTVRLQNNSGEDMPNRRIDDKLPGQPLDWNDGKSAAVEQPIQSAEDDIKTVLQDAVLQHATALLKYTNTESFALQIPDTETHIMAGPRERIAAFLGHEIEYMRGGDVKTWQQRAWEDGCDTELQPDPKHYSDEMQEEIDDLRAELARRCCAQRGDNNESSFGASAFITPEYKAAQKEKNAAVSARLSALASQSQAAQPSDDQADFLASIRNTREAYSDVTVVGEALDHLETVHFAHLAGQSQATKVQAVPADYVLMPKRLTAENGAKSLFMGEFKEQITVECPECNGDEECHVCGGDGYVEKDITVEWDTIKRIYALAVEHLANHTAQEVTQQAAPDAWMHEDGRVVTAATMESAKRDGGAMRSSLAGYTIPLGRIAPVDQQAAKAETAEQAIDVRYEFEKWMSDRGESTSYIGDGLYSSGAVCDQAEAFAAGVELARRFRAQGGNTNANGSVIAPTTSTVSAPDKISADTKRIDWLIANHRWSIRWRLKKGAEQWQMVDDGESWGQWGGFRNVLDAAMRTSPNKGEAA